jgi:membrane protein DedA with SNARE-associated domain
VDGLGTLLLAASDAAANAPDSTKEMMIRLVADYSYVGVFLFLIACGLGFPAPEEIALIGGGYAVYRAHPAPDGWPFVTLMITVAMLGVLVGDSILWYIGRRVGDHPEKVPFIGRHLNPKRMKRARAMFARHGAKAVFFGRFLFGIRAVTFFVSGSLHVPWTTFLLMDGLAGLVSVPISIFLAWWFGASLEGAVDAIAKVDKAILIGVIVLAVIVLTIAWRKRKSLPFIGDGDESDEAPVPGAATAATAPPPAAPLSNPAS